VSIYGRRKGVKEILGAHHAPLHGNTIAPSSAGVPDERPEWAHLRRSNPANHLLPVGAQWLERLPGEVSPHALATHYPRIVNLLALQWNDKRVCSAYFEDLLNDRRGGRRGFPPDVRRDLMSLREFWYSGTLGLK
jgi:hypothetical protein